MSDLLYGTTVYACTGNNKVRLCLHHDAQIPRSCTKAGEFHLICKRQKLLAGNSINWAATLVPLLASKFLQECGGQGLCSVVDNECALVVQEVTTSRDVVLAGGNDLICGPATV